jgi:hypothetical protein
MMILGSALRVFMEGGLLMWPLVLIVLMVFGIVIRACWHLFARGGSDTLAIESCLDGLLFWGGFSVIIGVLGSAVGYNKALTVLAQRGLANPRALWAGGAEGMVSSIFGLLILAGAGVCWYVLRWQYLRDRT